jgi:hypothetical protein
MAFVNVVGGNEIYNFRIQTFEHFYSKFRSKTVFKPRLSKTKLAGRALRRDIASLHRARASASAPRTARGPAD